MTKKEFYVKYKNITEADLNSLKFITQKEGYTTKEVEAYKCLRTLKNDLRVYTKKNSLETANPKCSVARIIFKTEEEKIALLDAIKFDMVRVYEYLMITLIKNHGEEDPMVKSQRREDWNFPEINNTTIQNTKIYGSNTAVHTVITGNRYTKYFSK